MCEYMNDCSGRGQCSESGTCNCAIVPGYKYKGADCSQEALQDWGPHNKWVQGHAWVYYTFFNYLDDVRFQISMITNTSSFNVYVGYGTESNPNQFNFDQVYKNIPPM